MGSLLLTGSALIMIPLRCNRLTLQNRILEKLIVAQLASKLCMFHITICSSFSSHEPTTQLDHERCVAAQPHPYTLFCDIIFSVVHTHMLSHLK